MVVPLQSLKPEIIYTLSEALEQVNALQVQKADLSNTLTQERHVFSRIIQELTSENTALKEEKEQLKRWLNNEQERGIDKERTITSLEDIIAEVRVALANKTEETLRKEWQLKELQEMLFGQCSEKFIPDPESTQTAIQQTLGVEFDRTEIEAIIEQAIASSHTDTTSVIATKTSRRQKRHHVHKGRRPIPAHLETETIVYDLPGDKTGMKPMGKKVSVYYDIISGKLIRKEEHHLHINQQTEQSIEPQFSPG